jgi:hypothetical protein
MLQGFAYGLISPVDVCGSWLRAIGIALLTMSFQAVKSAMANPIKVENRIIILMIKNIGQSPGEISLQINGTPLCAFVLACQLFSNLQKAEHL